MDSRKSIRAKLAASLTTGLAFVVMTACSNEANAQLRTGRQSNRDFYSSGTPVEQARDRQLENDEDSEENISQISHTEPSRIKTASKPGSKTLVKASSNASADRAPVRVKPSAQVRTASAGVPQKTSIVKSKVVKASCPNCEQGIEHTHDGETVYDSNDAVESYDSSCDSCGGNCGGTCGGDLCCPTFGSTSDPCINIRFPSVFGRVLDRVSARVEAATFWPDGQFLPPLVRTGEIGAAGSNDLFGGATVLDSAAQGLRGEFGTFFQRDSCSGLMFRFFDVNAESLTYNSVLNGAPTVVRPYLDPVGNTQESISINELNVTNGGILAHATSKVYGGDVLFRQLMSRSRFGQSEVLVGYQHDRLADRITLDSVTTAVNTLQLHDRFTTDNRFNGGVIGLSGISYARNWSLSGMFKMGFGNMDRNVVIEGSQIITVPGNPPSVNTTNSGLLARTTNSGTYNFDTFVVTPEFNFTLGYRLTRKMELSVGYTYLKLPKVARAADQIDRDMAANLSDPLVGAARPSFNLLESNFALQSLNYGLQYRY